MIVDGKAIAETMLSELKEEINSQELKPTLTVIVVGSDPVTERFLSLKKKKAEGIGIEVIEKRFPDSVSNEELIFEIQKINGPIIVQLPLPGHIDKDSVLDSIPVEYDVDVLSNKSNDIFSENKLSILPPTTGAISEILKFYNVPIDGKKVVIIGRGALVGKPASIWFKNQNADIQIIGRDTQNISDYTKNADIIISGAGVPCLIKPDDLKEGVVLIDAGTSESDGKLAGDADPKCSEKCSVFTPVPGGVGPITVAVLLSNVITYTK